MIETSELQGLASQLEALRAQSDTVILALRTCRDMTAAGRRSLDRHLSRAAYLGLAIRIAEAVKANPDGFRAFYRETIGEAL